MRLSAAEADLIAAALGLEPRDFIERYTAVTADRRSLTLIERPDGGCIMLSEGNICRVNAVKPRQCRTFPEGWRFPGFETLCQARSDTEA